MKRYDVTLQVPVNVRVSGVAAERSSEAIKVAESQVDLHGLFDREQPAAGVDFTAYAEEVSEALVDRVGDREHEVSRWFVWRDGRWMPLGSTPLGQLKRLDAETQNIRKDLCFAQPGEVIWQANVEFRELLVVVADGYGGASLLYVAGNYPVDYLLHEQVNFRSEETACAAAEKRLVSINTG